MTKIRITSRTSSINCSILCFSSRQGIFGYSSTYWLNLMCEAYRIDRTILHSNIFARRIHGNTIFMRKKHVYPTAIFIKFNKLMILLLTNNKCSIHNNIIIVINIFYHMNNIYWMQRMFGLFFHLFRSRTQLNSTICMIDPHGKGILYIAQSLIDNSIQYISWQHKNQIKNRFHV